MKKMATEFYAPQKHTLQKAILEKSRLKCISDAIINSALILNITKIRMF